LALPSVKVPSDLSLHPYVDLIQPSLDILAEDSISIERAIDDMNQMFAKIKNAENQSDQKMETF
jgi:hypothetical protein